MSIILAGLDRGRRPAGSDDPRSLLTQGDLLVLGQREEIKMFSKYGLILFILSLTAFIASILAELTFLTTFLFFMSMVIGASLFILCDNAEDDKDGDQQ